MELIVHIIISNNELFTKKKRQKLLSEIEKSYSVGWMICAIFYINNIVIDLFSAWKIAFPICLDDAGEKDHGGFCQWEQSCIYWTKVVSNPGRWLRITVFLAVTSPYTAVYDEIRHENGPYMCHIFRSGKTLTVSVTAEIQQHYRSIPRRPRHSFLRTYFCHDVNAFI